MDPVVVIVVAIAAVVLIAVIITVLTSVLSKRTISFRTGKVKFTSEIPEVKARKGAEIVLPQLSSQYYDFMGWYYDAACTERACITKMPADNLVLHAGWRKKQAPKPEVSSEPVLDLGGAIAHNLSFRVELDF